jgi:hypothetical protein
MSPDTDPESFLDALAFELRCRRVPALRFELRQWVRDCWPLIEADLSPGKWAMAYLEQHRGQPAETR